MKEWIDPDWLTNWSNGYRVDFPAPGDLETLSWRLERHEVPNAHKGEFQRRFPNHCVALFDECLIVRLWL